MIKEELVVIRVAVEERHTLSGGILLQRPGHKTAHYKCIGFKSLVYRRRLVHTPGDGFKIMNGKNVRIAAPVPAHHIKRMCTVMQPIHHAFLFGTDKVISFFIKSLKILGRTYITFAIR